MIPVCICVLHPLGQRSYWTIIPCQEIDTPDTSILSSGLMALDSVLNTAEALVRTDAGSLD
jgi:hypothetical protein